MSRIVLVVTDLGPTSPQAIAAIREHTGLSIAEIVERTKCGSPLYDLQVYGDQLAERVAATRNLVLTLQDNGASVEMYELLPGEFLEQANRDALFKVDLEILDNMLAAQERDSHHDEEIAAVIEDEEGS